MATFSAQQVAALKDLIDTGEVDVNDVLDIIRQGHDQTTIFVTTPPNKALIDSIKSAVQGAAPTTSTTQMFSPGPWIRIAP